MPITATIILPGIWGAEPDALGPASLIYIAANKRLGAKSRGEDQFLMSSSYLYMCSMAHVCLHLDIPVCIHIHTKITYPYTYNSLVGQLPSMCKALSSIPNMIKMIKKNTNNEDYLIENKIKNQLTKY